MTTSTQSSFRGRRSKATTSARSTCRGGGAGARRRRAELIALSDLVVSAGGTTNREAAALGVPVYTTFGGRLGGVDEELIQQGRLVPITDPRALVVRRGNQGERTRVRRDPAKFLDLMLGL